MEELRQKKKGLEGKNILLKEILRKKMNKKRLKIKKPGLFLFLRIKVLIELLRN